MSAAADCPFPTVFLGSQCPFFAVSLESGLGITGSSRINVDIMIKWRNSLHFFYSLYWQEQRVLSQYNSSFLLSSGFIDSWSEVLTCRQWSQIAFTFLEYFQSFQFLSGTYFCDSEFSDCCWIYTTNLRHLLSVCMCIAFISITQYPVGLDLNNYC